MSVIVDNVGLILAGLRMTLLITTAASLCGLLLGTLLAVFRVSPIPPLRAAGAVWVAVTCNVPVLCLMVLLAFGLPALGLSVPLPAAAVIGITLSASGFICETVRSGINAVPVGSAEAARALGLTFSQSLRLVILPQALSRIIQPLVNIIISVLIASSLAAAIGVGELTNVTQQLNLRYAQAVITFLTSGLTYLAIAYLLTRGGALLERRLTRIEGCA